MSDVDKEFSLGIDKDGPTVFGITEVMKNSVAASLKFNPNMRQDILIEHKLLGRIPAWEASIHDACEMVRTHLIKQMKYFIGLEKEMTHV